MQHRLIATLLIATLIGCGDDETTPAGGGGTGGSGGGGAEGGASCEDLGGRCLALPDGFEGPIELHDNGIATCTNPAFQGGYEGDPFVAPDATCGCACGAPDAACELEAVAHDDVDCDITGSISDVTLPSGVCTAVENGADPTLGLVMTATPSGACISDEAPATRPAVAFEPKVDGCNVNLDTCDGVVSCFPDSVKTYCIFSETETECPSGFDVAHRVVRTVDLEDTRDCACTCGGGDITCAPTLDLFSDDACATAVSGTAGECVAGEQGEAISSVMADGGVVANCSAATNEVTGSVEVAGSGILVCCVP